jgi:cation transport ATPase
VVFAGTSTEGALDCVASSTGSATVLASIIRLVGAAQASASGAKLVDKVSIFVVVVAFRGFFSWVVVLCRCRVGSDSLFPSWSLHACALEPPRRRR